MFYVCSEIEEEEMEMGDPGFTFFADNFLGGTLFFTDDQVGKYMRALCAQKINGHLTLDQLNVFIKNDPVVLAKFTTDENGLYYNVRLQKEIDKREQFSNNQRKRIEKRWNKEDTPVLPGKYPGSTPVIPGYYPGTTPVLPVCETETESLSILRNNLNIKKQENKEGVQGEKKNGAPPSAFCKREGKKVPAEKHGTYVLLTPDEYHRMVDEWGEKFTQTAIAEYDSRYPNSKAIRSHTDHNRAIRDYVNRGYICSGKTPRPQTSKTPTKLPDPTEIGTPEERAEALKNPFAKRRGGDPQPVGEILTEMKGNGWP